MLYDYVYDYVYMCSVYDMKLRMICVTIVYLCLIYNDILQSLYIHTAHVYYTLYTYCTFILYTI